MSKKILLEKLFEAHSKDLQDVVPDLKNVFICPICFKDFSPEHLGQEVLSEGHVWPKILQAKSQIASQQRVLLCKKCNSSSGRRGDSQIKHLEKLRLADKTGELYGTQQVQFLKADGTQISLQGEGRIEKESNRAYLKFPPKINDPQQLEMLRTVITNEEIPFITVQNARPYKTELAQPSMITSTYLFAFYTFGYRYILPNYFSPLRFYIQNSFDYPDGFVPPLPELETLSSFFCESEFRENPEIGIVVPLKEEMPVHIEVFFLNYLTRLPFPLVPEIFAEILKIGIEQVGDTSTLYFPIKCNKSRPHACIWDYVLGKPISTTS
jgi:hypothetical protein